MIKNVKELFDDSNKNLGYQVKILHGRMPAQFNICDNGLISEYENSFL